MEGYAVYRDLDRLICDPQDCFQVADYTDKWTRNGTRL